MDKELWVRCIWFSDYEVSNFARVRFIGSTEKRTTRQKKLPSYGQIISPSKTDGGRYLSVRMRFSCDSPTKIVKLHRLVFFSFNPDIEIKEGYEVDHIKNDRMNCRLDNLQYISHSENIAKHYKGTQKSSVHSGVYWNKRQNVWSTMIRYKGKRYFLGNYIDQDKAGLSYQTAFKNLQEYGCISAPINK